MSITVHSVVVNEDQFIKPAILSVLPFVEKILLYDTGSSDKTVELVKSIKSHKIEFEEKGSVSKENYVKLRQEQIDRTKTDFFMILDGDEIWPKESLKKFFTTLQNMPKDKLAVICKTRNAVGDVYHYLPDDTGRYEFLGMKGHFSMRGFRNVPELTVAGIYPLETFKFRGKSLNSWDEKLEFCDTWYFHATHLKRSSSSRKVPGFRLRKIEKGLPFVPSELPEELLKIPRPHRPLLYEVVAGVISPLKKLKASYAKI